MRFLFSDEDLQALYAEGPTGPKGRKVARRLPAGVVNRFFKAMNRIAQAVDTNDLAASRAFHYHALVGDRTGQYAMRLDDQFRLVMTETKDEKGELLLILEIVDYH